MSIRYLYLIGGLLLPLFWVTQVWGQEIQPLDSLQQRRSGFSLGLSVGPNLTTLDVQIDFDNRVVKDYNVVLGYYLSVYTGVRLGPLHMRTGVSFVNGGALYNGTEFLDADEVKINFITIPIDLRLKLPLGKGAVPYLFMGPQFRYQYTLDDFDAEFRDDIRHLATTASVGLGVRLTIPGTTIAFSPELRYGIDITGLVDGEVTVQDEVYRIGDEFKADMVQLGIVIGM